MEDLDIIKTRIDSVLPILNERNRRIYLAAEAQSIGQGGKSIIAKLISVTRRTIAKGEKEKLNIIRSDFHGEWNYILKPSLR